MMDPATFKREFLLNTPKASISTDASAGKSTLGSSAQIKSSDKPAEDDALNSKMNNLSISNSTVPASVNEAKKDTLEAASSTKDTSESSNSKEKEGEEEAEDLSRTFTSTGYMPSDGIALRNIWISMGYPNPVMRMCKDPSTRDIFSLWICYFDVVNLFPQSHTFLPSPSAAELTNRNFNIVDIPGRGKGMRATRNIVRGETIIRETPVFLAPLYFALPKTRDYTDDVGFKMYDTMLEIGMDKLKPEDKARIMELYNCHEEKYPHTGRFKTNAVGCTFEGATLKSYGGICPTISRVNHRFVPCQSNYDPRSKLTLFTRMFAYTITTTTATTT